MNQPAPTHSPVDRLDEVIAHVASVFRGKDHIVRLTLASLIARGHVLLEDVPGVGKTTLALALSRSLGLDFRRIQFTSDLLPTDIVGVTVFKQNKGEFEFTQGPIFSNIVLADEINRTTPRTQSALLEAMSERKVSVDNHTHILPDPFLVIATQNPLEHHGTYPLPESQLDRFLIRASIGYPVSEIERGILLDRSGSQPVFDLEPVLNEGEFKQIQEQADKVLLGEPIVDYILKIVEATRTDSRVRIGVSTRGALAMASASRALALTDGRDFVIPDDVRELAIPCFAHRISLSASRSEGGMAQSEATLEDIVATIAIPT